MRKPNLFILGAPKCGTTSLMDWLGQHPNIYTSPYKEPHFFYSPYSPPLSLKEYESLFARAKASHKYLAEGSTWYLFSGIAAPRILAFNPEARFIVCLRNPLEMLPSLHAQKRLSGVEALAVLEDAWRASPERARGTPVGIRHLPKGDPRHMAYKEACSLGSQVLKLLNQVDSTKVFFCFFEDVKNDPEILFAKICAWLGIEHCKNVNFTYRNKARQPRSWFVNQALRGASNIRKSMLRRRLHWGVFARLQALNSKEQRYDRVTPSLREEMKCAFADEITLLEALTGRDLSTWLT